MTSRKSISSLAAGLAFGLCLITGAVAWAEETEDLPPSEADNAIMQLQDADQEAIAKDLSPTLKPIYELGQDDKKTLERLDEPGWFDSVATCGEVEQILMPLAARYYLLAKNGKGRPADPVARFHLGNGARLERLNFLCDRSERGMRQAHGLMVNYLYDLAAIEKNHEAYAENGEIVASPAVKRLLKDLTSRDLTPVQ